MLLGIKNLMVKADHSLPDLVVMVACASRGGSESASQNILAKANPVQVSKVSESEVAQEP